MKKTIISYSLIIIAVVILNALDALAVRREIIFPDTFSLVSVAPRHLGFAFDGKVGLTIVSQRDNSYHLYSFLIKEQMIVGHVDLGPDLGFISENDFSSFIFIKVHSDTGLVVVYGTASDQSQKVLAFASDQQGHLRALWKVSFPQSFIASSGVNFKEDGSRICLLYRDSRVHAVILDSADGSMLATVNISGTGITAKSAATDSLASMIKATVRATDFFDLFFVGWIAFDERHERVVVMAGDSVYLFTSRNDTLNLESKISAASLDVSDLIERAFSQDGRFIVGIYAFSISKKPKQNEFIFASFDLESKTANKVLIRSKFNTEGNPTTFHSPSGNLLMALSVTYKDSKNTLRIIRGTSRNAIILTLMPDGSLIKSVDVEVPEQTRVNTGLNIIGESSSVEVTAAGALALLPTTNGRMFTFDTLTGEIIDDQDLNVKTGLSAIRLVESSSLVVFSAGNRFVLVDVELGPSIDSVEVKKNHTVISGANFLSGVRVQINGKDVEEVTRDSADPGREIVINRGKKDFPIGEEVTIVVVNRDNKSSVPVKLRVE